MNNEKFKLSLDNGDIILCSKTGNGKRLGYIAGGPGSFYFNGLSGIKEIYTLISYDVLWTYSKAGPVQNKKITTMTKSDLIHYDHLIVNALKEHFKVTEIDGFGFSAPGALLFEEALINPNDYKAIIGTGIGLTQLDPTFSKTNEVFYQLASKDRQQAFDRFQTNYNRFLTALNETIYDESMRFFDVNSSTDIPLQPHKQFVAETLAMIPKSLFNFSDSVKAKNTIIEHWKENPFGEYIDKRMQEHFFNNIYPSLQTLSNLFQLAKMGKKILLIYGDSDFITPLSEETKTQLHKEPNITLKIIENCGHMPYIEQSKKYKEILECIAMEENEDQEGATVETVLNNIVANMPGHIYWKNREGVYLGCNNRQAESLGLRYGTEVIGKTDFELPWQQGVAQTFRENDLKIMESGQTLILEERSQVDGKESIVLSQKAPLRDSKGEIIGIIGVSIDITDRKMLLENLKDEKTRAEKRAVSSQENLERIIACMPGSVYWKDTDGIYLGCNDTMANLMGLAKSEIIGKSDFDFADIFGSMKISEAFRKADNEVISSGVPNLNVEEPPFHFADGKIIYQLSNRVPLLDENNKIVGIIGISIDISDQKKMEEQLREAIAAANIANRAKSEFLRNMEHQLRTPFSGVYSLVSIAAAQETNPELKELLEITYNSGQELLTLINDIIDFSRNEIDSNIVLDKKFDFKQLIEKAIILEKPAALIKQLELSYSYPEDLPTIFISDPKRLQGILLQLLSNAIKFTPAGSIKVEVKLGKKIDDKTYIIQLRVTDTGIGISEENQAFIYERFYRVSPANQNKYVGAGLGLTTVKRLVQDLEGEIDVLSQLGQGTTFVCTFRFNRPLLDEVINDEVDEKKYSLFLQDKK